MAPVPPRRCPVPLANAVRETVERSGLDAELTVVGTPPVVHTDPRRLDRIVTNLVLNAHRHGKPPVDVTVNGASITVRDHGPGYPPDVLTQGPQWFRTGAAERGRGTGLGLTIALGQARVLGATLTLDNAPDGGAQATLRLDGALPNTPEPPAPDT